MASGYSLILIVIVFGAMTFFMSRSQKKQQQERQSLLDKMKIGDQIVTIGGLHGVISEFDDAKKTVILDCEGIFLEFSRSAIAKVTSSATETTETNTAEPASTVETTEDTSDDTQD